jgi:hypothetical protein
VEALFDFDPSTMEWTLDEPPLPLKEGQKVEILEDLGEWVVGQLPGKPETQGYFPKAYVGAFVLPQVDEPGAVGDTGDTRPAELPILEAIFDFDPAGMEWPLEEAPLPLKGGQKVYVVEKEGEWILGRMVDEPDKEGFFPASYVRALDSVANAPPPRIVEALFDFDPAGMAWPLEEGAPLPLKEGAMVEVLEDDGGDWILGRLVGDASKEGFFPKTYVQNVAAQPVILEAQFDFDPATIEWPLEDAEPLALRAGMKVEVITDDDSGWVLGRLVDKPECEGYFPKSYVG